MKQLKEHNPGWLTRWSDEVPGGPLLTVMIIGALCAVFATFLVVPKQPDYDYAGVLAQVNRNAEDAKTLEMITRIDDAPITSDTLKWSGDLTVTGDLYVTYDDLTTSTLLLDGGVFFLDSASIVSFRVHRASIIFDSDNDPNWFINDDYPTTGTLKTIDGTLTIRIGDQEIVIREQEPLEVKWTFEPDDLWKQSVNMDPLYDNFTPELAVPQLSYQEQRDKILIDYRRRNYSWRSTP